MIEWSFHDSRKAPFHKNGHLCRAVGLSKYITTNSDDKVPDPELFAPEHRNTILSPLSNPTPYMHKSQKVQWCQHEVQYCKRTAPSDSKRFTLEMYTSVKYLRAYKLLWNASILGLGVNRDRRVKCGNLYKTLLKGWLPTEA